MLPDNELMNDFQLDLPYERGPVVSDYMRNSPEAYRHKIFPKPVKTLTYEDIDRLVQEAKTKYPVTVRSILYHCYDENDALNSISQMRNTRPEYFRKVKR